MSIDTTRSYRVRWIRSVGTIATISSILPLLPNTTDCYYLCCSYRPRSSLVENILQRKKTESNQTKIHEKILQQKKDLTILTK